MAYKILAIIRASTEHQETESQKKEVKDFILSLRGEDSKPLFTEQEIDYIKVEGASARKMNDKYREMIREIKHRILTTPTMRNVALWHLNRLGRVKMCLTEMEHFFVENRVQMYVKHGFDVPLLDKDGKETLGASIAFSVYSAMVEEETKEMFAKFARGKNKLKEEGKYAGGQLHFGYRLTENRTYEIDPEQAAIVSEIFKRYATGNYSIYKLVDELNHQGVMKRGKKLTYNMVRNILVDDSYLGYQSKRQRTWEPIIDQETFDQCAAVRSNIIAIKKTTKESRNVNFGVGLLKCECGNNFIAYGSSYTCYGKVNNHRKKKVVNCTAPVVPRHVIDEILVLVAVNLHHSFLMTVDTHSLAEYEQKRDTFDVMIANANKDIEDAQGRKKALNRRCYVQGKISESELDEMTIDIDSEIAKFRSQVTYYMSERKQVEAVIAQLTQSPDERYLETLLMLNYDTDVMEDRMRLKDMMVKHIKDVRLQRFMDGKHKCIEITVNAVNGLQFVFVYDTWLNNHRKQESYPIFLKHEGKLLPLRHIECDTDGVADYMAVENDEVTHIIEDRVQLHVSNVSEQVSATHSLVRRRLIEASIKLYKEEHGKDVLTEQEINMTTKQVNDNIGF